MSSSGHPEPPKKLYKASESVNVGCCQVYKSVGDTRNLGNICNKLKRVASRSHRMRTRRRRRSHIQDGGSTTKLLMQNEAVT